MTKIKTGECRMCGAPIYVPSIWYGINPPPIEHTCGCKGTETVTTAQTTDTMNVVGCTCGLCKIHNKQP